MPPNFTGRAGPNALA